MTPRVDMAPTISRARPIILPVLQSPLVRHPVGRRAPPPATGLPPCQGGTSPPRDAVQPRPGAAPPVAAPERPPEPGPGPEDLPAAPASRALRLAPPRECQR